MVVLFWVCVVLLMVYIVQRGVVHIDSREDERLRTGEG
jgi:hypothetical protein